MDPIEQVNFETDSTVSIIHELQHGNKIEYIHPNSLSYSSETLMADLSVLKIDSLKNGGYKLEKKKKVNLNEMDCIFFRKDPPINYSYIMTAQKLKKLEYQNTLVLNSPKSLLEFNEKVLGYDLSNPKVPTLLTSSLKDIEEFLDKNRDIVLKPTNLMAGKGIIRLKSSEKSKISIISSHINEHKMIIAQKYLSQIRNGDSRIIIYDGIIEKKILVRYPAKNDFRANLACGGTFEIKDLNKKYLPLLNKIASYLKYHNIFFAGVDMIDNYVTEINITSPTGIQQIGGNLATKIANSLLQKIKTHHEYTK